MQSVKFSYEGTCGLPQEFMHEYYDNIDAALGIIAVESKKGYDTQYAPFSLPLDEGMHAQISSQVEQDRSLTPAVLVVVGIGGSNLGTMAVEQALHGKFYNDYTRHTRIYYVDTLDPDSITVIMQILDNYWQNNKLVIINVISKSGTTVETLVNFSILHDSIINCDERKKNTKFVITTDKDSHLWDFARAYSYTCLVIPSLVGGRYSIFSAVGLYPLGILGVPLASLLEGASTMLEEAYSKNTSQYLMIKQRTALLCAYFNQKIPLHDMFIFDSDCQAIGLWYRQLMAESLGKKYDLKGNLVHYGMMPTVSMGTVDLHSVAQLYLAGLSLRCTTFLTVEQTAYDQVIPKVDTLFPKNSYIEGKTLLSVRKAILAGVQNAYFKQGMPYMTITLPQKNAYTIGYLLQMYMLEIVIMGYVFTIDPFNQPEVELYKSETREMLTLE